MPKGRKVGEAYVEIGADNSKLNQGLDQAKTKTEDLGGSAKKAESSYIAFFNRAGDAAAKFKAVVSKIAIPLAVIGAIASIGRLLSKASREAEELRAKFQEIGDSMQDAAQREEIALRSVNDLSQKRKQILLELKASQEQNAKARLAEIDSEKILLGINAKYLGSTAINRVLREVGLRRSLNDAIKQSVDAEDNLNKGAERRLKLLKEEQASRKALAAEAAKDFDQQTRLLEAQAEGQEALIREQINQLATEYGEAIAKAEDEAQETALDRRFAAMRRILMQQLQDIEAANQAQIDADNKAAEEKRNREEEAHQKRIRDIEEESRKRMKALEDYFRRQEEGFDRLNQDLIVGLKGIATAVQQGNRDRGETIVLGGGA